MVEVVGSNSIHAWKREGSPRYWLILLLIAMAIGLLYAFIDIASYFIVSLVIAAICRPIVDFISQGKFGWLKVPRILAVFVSFVILIAVLVLFSLLFLPMISDQAALLSTIDYGNFLDDLVSPVRSLEQTFIELGVPKAKVGFLEKPLRDSIPRLIKSIDFQVVLSSFIDVTSSFLVGTLAVFFFSFFLLYERGVMYKKMFSFVRNSYFELMFSSLLKSERLLSNYLLGLLLQMLSVFTMVSLGLTITQIPYAMTIGLFAAFANLIPYVGPLLGGTFGILVASLTAMNGMSAGVSPDYINILIRVIPVFSVVQLADNVILQPLIFGRSIKAHPLEIFVIIFVGATIAQVPGMILAIPTYAFVKVMVTEFGRGFRQYQTFKSL